MILGEKLIVALLVKIFPTFCGMRLFLTVFKRSLLTFRHSITCWLLRNSVSSYITSNLEHRPVLAVVSC